MAPDRRAGAPPDRIDRRVGMAVFLGSWAMLFLTLFFAYGVLRQGAMAWPPPGAPRLPLLLPALSTAVLALSSVVLERGRTGVAALLAVAFLALQARLFSGVYADGLTPGSGPYGSVFYTFTAVHAAHALVGAAALAWLRLRGRPAGLWRAYWHFVGVVWLLLFVLVFVP